MSSSIISFSPWRSRSSSLSSQPTRRQSSHDDVAEAATARDDSAQRLSSSVGSPKACREPIRSYLHASVRGQLAPVDSSQNARTVREDTAELASYLLSDGTTPRIPSFLQRSKVSAQDLLSPAQDAHKRAEDEATASATILEVSEPTSPEERSADAAAVTTIEDTGPSVLSNLLKRLPSRSAAVDAPNSTEQPPVEPRQRWKPSQEEQDQPRPSEQTPIATEQTPLLGHVSDESDDIGDLEGQKDKSRRWYAGFVEKRQKIEGHVSHAVKVAVNPRRWDRKALWHNMVVEPASCVPAVTVGLLLNILDALSYGMILFPLGKELFSHLGSAGISVYYVSTIVAQVTFSSGSIFRGAVGSELIEVVPFFHNMAQRIMDNIGEDKPDAVIATTIVAYAASSIMTGLVFYLMGKFKFGYMVGFIPRHILIGCIGGVGWFLVATGFEVSARLNGIEYNLDTLNKLTQTDTLLLWIIPLVLAIFLFYGQSRIRSKYFLPLFILAIPLIFYILVLSINALETDALRDKGWIFEGPPAGEPWWYFYTLYQFNLVQWDAILEVVPAMMALTFFGILHVPINVPALALNTGEDNADLDKELKLHGYSNILSGCMGSIQNYLVYANTIFFVRSGGDSRLAGFMLAAATFGVMMIGPSLIEFIPVMMVATLIFDLGFELLLEAIWLPRKKLKVAEYLTVIVIVLVMGIHDFVVGIGVGILLAFVSLIIQTSRVSAVRGTYDGGIVSSTVRRNPAQHHYLHQVGQQIYIMKLTGYLFFGTIVSVEENIRALLDDHAFSKKPIKFLILDLWHVTGLDYSAGEAFNTISRLLDKKGVLFVLSGVDAESQLGRNLRAVGLDNDKIEVNMLPNLNSALESCENELLKTLYARQEELNSAKRNATPSLDVPTVANSSSLSSFGQPFNSPRQSHLVEAAREALTRVDIPHPSKWQSFNEPLRLMLQIFQSLSGKNEDFWFQATCYFQRKEYPAGTILFRRGEKATGFFLVERGIIRAEYDLPQGWLCESIVAGTTCGELPFFSETERTATALVERDCVVWQMDCKSWRRLQKDQPGIAREFLRISLKLTSERMSSITSYILTTAG
ncbi:sulfate transporter family protein [Metarhizium album ARSEF 1941]|uniref:Sulfate transporter family protein n=1 Tax=Metarhizium album (strain ARSEF 1941) TaxID=1081103 RepID=A0A0B2X2C6_METAS|nr:sulfate transporter family protein [Metarhizium album ARSEF 1941]KHN99887.1 sulfate transporter family protein [Metarhizium album ARSEF 1941]